MNNPAGSRPAPLGGSMMSADAAIGQVQDRRAAEAMSELQSQTKATATGPSEAKTEADDMIQKQIPKTVRGTVIGDLPYAAFKERYAQVYEQVRDKDHLLSGRVRYETQLSGMSLVIRSLRQRDRRSLAAWAPDARAEHHDFLEQDFQYRLRLVVLSIESIGDAVFPAESPDPSRPGEWAGREDVTQALGYAEDWDETLFSMILSLLNDLETAKHYALLENLGNQ